MSLVQKADPTRAIASGVLTTVTASDTIQTGLREILQAAATPGDDFIVAAYGVTVAISDQTTAPGAFVIKSWMNTGAADATPKAATTFGKKVYWVVIGK